MKKFIDIQDCVSRGPGEIERRGDIKSGESRRRKRDMLRMAKLWGEVFEAEATKEARAKREKVLKEIARRYGMKW